MAKCSECGEEFIPRHKNQVTCGSPECKKLRKNRLRRTGVEREFYCKICGELTWDNRKRTVLCGKKSCREEYKRLFSEKKKQEGLYNYRERYSYNKKKNDSKRYSKSDLISIWYMKLKGVKNKDIAKKMKRNYEPLCHKMREMAKYSENYEEIIFEAEERYKKEMHSRALRSRSDKISYWNEVVDKCFKK